MNNGLIKITIMLASLLVQIAYSMDNTRFADSKIMLVPNAVSENCEILSIIKLSEQRNISKEFEWIEIKQKQKNRKIQTRAIMQYLEFLDKEKNPIQNRIERTKDLKRHREELKNEYNRLMTSRPNFELADAQRHITKEIESLHEEICINSKIIENFQKKKSDFIKKLHDLDILIPGSNQSFGKRKLEEVVTRDQKRQKIENNSVDGNPIIDITDSVRQNKPMMLRLDQGVKLKFGDKIIQIGSNANISRFGQGLFKRLRTDDKNVNNTKRFKQNEHYMNLTTEQEKAKQEYDHFVDQNFARSAELTKRLKWLTEQLHCPNTTSEQKNNYIEEARQNEQEAIKVSQQEENLRMKLQGLGFNLDCDSKKQAVIEDYQGYVRKTMPRVQEITRELEKCEKIIEESTDTNELSSAANTKKSLELEWNMLKTQLDTKENAAKDLGIGLAELKNSSYHARFTGLKNIENESKVANSQLDSLKERHQELLTKINGTQNSNQVAALRDEILALEIQMQEYGHLVPTNWH